MNGRTLFQRIFTLFLIAFLIGVFVSALTTDPVVASPSTAAFYSTQTSHQNLQLALYANIETAGVVISGDQLPENAEMEYRVVGESNWQAGHPLMNINDGRLVSSLFELAPDTNYEVRVTVGNDEIQNSIKTRPDEPQFSPAATIYVNGNAQSGGDGSPETPFKSIQDGVDNATPGTRILVADGVYHEEVVIPTSGDEGQWIQVQAAGENVILDGAEHLKGDIWTPHASEPGVWYTNIGDTVGYVARDGERYYQYDNIDGLLAGSGHNDVPMAEGWVLQSDNILYVRSLDDPKDHIWQIPRYEFGFKVEDEDWIWIEGFEIRFYGQDRSRGIYLKNASHIVIRHNKIHHNHEGVLIKWTGGADRGNYTRIEYNEIYDTPVFDWPWEAVKKTSMEGAAVKINGHIGTIVRGNEIHDMFDGVYSGKWEDLNNPEIAFDTDVYDNNIHHISDDALEPEGACVNNRFHHNTVDTIHDGISLAPVTAGPTWVLYSFFTNYDHTNIQFSNDTAGISLIYHNTSWTDFENKNAMTIYDPVHNAILRNNIFRGSRYAFEAPLTGSSGNDWDHNNWHTTRGDSSPHFKWENVRYDTRADLCAATSLECNGHDGEPGLSNPSAGDFQLQADSSNIDTGAVILGINTDYAGSAPDIGADEFPQDDQPESETEKVFQVFIPLVIANP
jgi:hypothetical protein